MARKSQVLIAGGGYAGLNAALHLADRRTAEHAPCDITLVDSRPYHLMKIRLHEAAVHGTEITVPLANLLSEGGIEMHQAAITGLDLEHRQVATDRGPLDYDYLVLALGSLTNFFAIPGLEEHGFRLDSLADASRLRGHIQEEVVRAAECSDPVERARHLRFVIGGAGYTGIELAGEMAELLPRLCTQVALDEHAAEIIVVDIMPRILPVLDEESAAFAARELEGHGVQLRTKVKVVSCSPQGITLDPGGEVPTATMVWAGGIRANPLAGGAGVEVGKQGRLVVDEMLRIPTHPEVFAVGDCALALDPSTHEAVPATAQLGLQEGRHAADNLLRVLSGRQPSPYSPHSRGEIVSVGHDRAVGWTKILGERQVKLRGLVGGLAKRAAEAEWELHLWHETHDLESILL